MEISNSTIQPSTLAHNMGVTFDEYMSMNKHIANVDCTQKLFFPFKKNSKNKGLSIIASTRVKLELGKRTFEYHGAWQLNNLSGKIKMLSSLNSFKNKTR